MESKKTHIILGIDEVGRGPWAGPLVVGAVALNPFDELSESWQSALTDSKKLSEKKRETLIPVIKEKSVSSGLGWVSSKELDQVGLAEALRLATRRAVIQIFHTTFPGYAAQLQNENDLNILPQKIISQLPFSEIIIDGTSNFLKNTSLEDTVCVLPKADLKIKAVSAASIIAKVARDNYMKELATKYPEYGFEKHVGYGTAAHKAALEKYGPCPEHRNSFKPIKKLSPTTTKGNKAEQIVAGYLAQKGHKILARNYKTKYYEIDIISATKEHIYFTEVKYRSSPNHGSPLEAIDKNKQDQMRFAAECFMDFLSSRLGRSQENLPSPILAAAAVSGTNYHLDKWLELIV